MIDKKLFTKDGDNTQPPFFTVKGENNQPYSPQTDLQEIVFDKIIQQNYDVFETFHNSFLVPGDGYYFLNAQATFSCKDGERKTPVGFGFCDIKNPNNYIVSSLVYHYIDGLKKSSLHYCHATLSSFLMLKRGQEITVKFNSENSGEVMGNSKLFSGLCIFPLE